MLAFSLSLCYTPLVATEIVLSYKLKLYPTRNKAETLAGLTALFRRLHSVATQSIADSGGSRPPSTIGRGYFVGRAHRRAGIDWQRSRKATAVLRLQAEKDLRWALKALPGSRSTKRQKRLLKVIDKTVHTLEQMRTRETLTGHPFKPPYLKAELLDVAETQAPRKARSFDYWIKIRGTSHSKNSHQGFYLPARKHVAINRTLALPGAVLNESAEVYRKKRKWYARINVTVPCPEPVAAAGWYGVDVGLRASVTCSDGYAGPDLRPLCKRH